MSQDNSNRAATVHPKNKPMTKAMASRTSRPVNMVNTVSSKAKTRAKDNKIGKNKCNTAEKKAKMATAMLKRAKKIQASSKVNTDSKARTNNNTVNKLSRASNSPPSAMPSRKAKPQ